MPNYLEVGPPICVSLHHLWETQERPERSWPWLQLGSAIIRGWDADIKILQYWDLSSEFFHFGARVFRMVSGKELRAEQGRWKREVLTNDGSVQPWWDLGSYNCKECQCQACVPVEKLDEKNHPGISKELSQGLFYVESKQQQFLLLFLVKWPFTCVSNIFICWVIHGCIYPPEAGWRFCNGTYFWWHYSKYNWSVILGKGTKTNWPVLFTIITTMISCLSLPLVTSTFTLGKSCQLSALSVLEQT